MVIFVSESSWAWTKRAPLDWITVNCRLCAVWLERSVHAISNRLSAVTVYAPIDCSSPEAKDEFYRNLFVISNRKLSCRSDSCWRLEQTNCLFNSQEDVSEVHALSDPKEPAAVTFPSRYAPTLDCPRLIQTIAIMWGWLIRCSSSPIKLGYTCISHP